MRARPVLGVVMLKVFHTADWHLGQSFLGFDRDFEHASFLDWLLEQLRDQRPDALLVAGDVFDSINPSAVSQKRFFSFLANAHAALPSLQIVVTAGNHDAAARLEAPAEALTSLNVTVVGTVSRNAEGAIDLQKFLVPLCSEDKTVQAIVLAVPFLRPSDVPLVSEAADAYLDGIRELYRQILEAALAMKSQLCPGAAVIAMGHCHMHGGEESSDSERRLLIGGAEAIGPETFGRDITYVALGHLHKAQQFDGGRIRYCGSPIPLSFAEARYRHRVLSLTLDSDQLTSVEELTIPRAVAMIAVPATGSATSATGSATPTTGSATIDNILSELEHLSELEQWTPDSSLTPEQYPFLEVRVLEDGPDPTRRRRIEQVIEGKPVRLASIKVESPSTNPLALEPDPALEAVDLKTISPEEIFLSAHREKYGNAADDAIVKAFREILLQEVPGS